VVGFFACLDLGRKSSLINRLIYHEILGLDYRTERLDWQENFIETKHLPSQYLEEDVVLLTDSEIARKIKMLDT
jgi:hypothetical protein